MIIFYFGLRKLPAFYFTYKFYCIQMWTSCVHIIFLVKVAFRWCHYSHLLLAIVLAEYTNLVFTLNTWSREVMVKLAEMNHNLEILPMLQNDINDSAQCMKTTCPNENQINELRRVERQQRSTKLSRCARWHRLLISKVRSDCCPRAAIATLASIVCC